MEVFVKKKWLKFYSKRSFHRFVLAHGKETTNQMNNWKSIHIPNSPTFLKSLFLVDVGEL